jgi:ABC-type lipoprotein export system ATPase subunit
MKSPTGSGNIDPGAEMLSLKELAGWTPRLAEVLQEYSIPYAGNENSSLAFLCEETGVDPAAVFAALTQTSQHSAPLQEVKSIEILGGHNKKGQKETISKLTVKPGQSVALVGTTGSGKSQLLADIESLAQGDSPSKRKIKINGLKPSNNLNFSPNVKPVAQVSQGMRFLLDTTVAEFLHLHASIRKVNDPEKIVKKAIAAGCSLCGEPFKASSQLALLSGGQSRALMIADTAIISHAPIILIDEIENAGIDKEKAIEFMVKQGKIAFIATHDPLLALKADMRIILQQGGMQQKLARSNDEKKVLNWLEKYNNKLFFLQKALRSGKRLKIPE